MEVKILCLMDKAFYISTGLHNANYVNYFYFMGFPSDIDKTSFDICAFEHPWRPTTKLTTKLEDLKHDLYDFSLKMFFLVYLLT